MEKLATTSLQTSGPNQHIPFDPESKVQLDFDRFTITQYIKSILQEKIQKATLKKYYKTHLKWYSRTFDVVDWDQWINKFCLQNLSARLQISEQKRSEDKKLCSCGASIEDDDQLFQCIGRPKFL